SGSESRGSLVNFRVVVCGSANQGGIARPMTSSRIDLLQGRTSLYEVSDIGAASPGRWQLAHLLKTMGATSLVKVTPAASFFLRNNAAEAASVKTTMTDKRFMAFLLAAICRPPAPEPPGAGPVCRRCNPDNRSSSRPRSDRPSGPLSSDQG